MESTRFKTDIKCSGCIEKVTPHLNAAIGEHNWKVDLADPLKILTVEGTKEAEKVKEALRKAGYKAEEL